MDGKQLQNQYKDHLSDYQSWNQKEHAQDHILYPKNIGYNLCIDETALSKGELYTILLNRDKRGRKGSIIAVVQGTKAEDIIAILMKIPKEQRNQVKEITLDMAGSMQKIAKTCFPRAMQVIDRFHVQKLVYEAVQELRITYRWQVMKDENKAIKAAKEQGVAYEPETFKNGDTLRQLLARSRYLLFKAPDKWTKSQKIRAEILFKQFDDIKQVYYYSLHLGKIFSTNYDKDVARAKLALWYSKIEEYGYETFATVANSIENHYERILNFFVNRSTNAAAEAFNAKIKAFRASFRGVADMRFFLFRLAKVYA
ncbi:transposase [Bacteroides sp. BFG-606]|uniref:ISAon1 family transposase n=1 Tax=unclassified Bacteroides TaxID=2646097 RepID=UPI0021660348|nr:transposase [Bacteroides sp. BFG-606]MCS2333893.1 transposase [Bacteroides sp. BFG-606]MCS2334323.1 transposase [Bacteroides sp. BFG-606]MCS2334476.1 transposase [Bacteroides sp. BFG-606]MCS2334857.1 transposase [Bacteroides sp. BFG-606]MCS2336584.1 transposase [Bacteroides sp. BFG-606]